MIILTNAFLIDCTGAEPVDGAAVVIEGSRCRGDQGERRLPGPDHDHL